MKYKEGQLIAVKSQFGTTHPYKYELARALENIPERSLSAHVQILRYDSYKIVPFLRTVVNLRYITPVEEYMNYLKEEKSIF